MPPPPIQLPLDWLMRKLGPRGARRRSAPDPGAARIRRRRDGPRRFSVTVPSWRATKDISMKDDLVEEVGRMIGYDSITPHGAADSGGGAAGQSASASSITRADAVAQGFTEVYNYSFVSEEAARAFGFDPADTWRWRIRSRRDQSLLRTSLLPGIWKNIVENAKHCDDFRLFEIGREIHKRAEGLPDEVPHLVAAI